MENAESILRYWFGTDEDDAAIIRDRSVLWWEKNPETDQEIRRRFEQTLEAELRGGHESWKATPGGWLARILLLDQFTRNMYRGTPRAFACDLRAQALAREALRLGMDRSLRAVKRVFLYLPFEHSEDAADQTASVELFSALYNEVPDAVKAPFGNFLDYAVKHKAVIDRFGRFPHRNTILGRISTPEERDFLKGPDSSF